VASAFFEVPTAISKQRCCWLAVALLPLLRSSWSKLIAERFLSGAISGGSEAARWPSTQPATTRKGAEAVQTHPAERPGGRRRCQPNGRAGEPWLNSFALSLAACEAWLDCATGHWLAPLTMRHHPHFPGYRTIAVPGHWLGPRSSTFRRRRAASRGCDSAATRHEIEAVVLGRVLRPAFAATSNMATSPIFWVVLPTSCANTDNLPLQIGLASGASTAYSPHSR